MYKIGIDLGGTFIKGGIVKHNEIIYKTKIETPESHSPSDVATAINELVIMLRNNLATGPDECEFIGIGSPGTVDAVNGTVLYSNNFGWERPVKLAEAISEAQKLPVRISNDANCAALGECISHGMDQNSTYVVLTLGTGVGSGIIINGKLYEGAHAGAVELGHIVIKDGGRKCTCGNRGCLESYASATALIHMANKKIMKMSKSDIKKSVLARNKMDGVEICGLTITEAVRMNDKFAKEVFDSYLKKLAVGIVNINNIFRPDVIYLGGGVCESFDLMDEYLNSYVKENSFAGAFGHIPAIKKSTSGNDAGILGAASL